jgi:hypothetical protein
LDLAEGVGGGRLLDIGVARHRQADVAVPEELANNDFDGTRAQDREGDRCQFTAIDLGSLVATSITTPSTITTTRPDPITGISTPAMIVKNETVEHATPELLDQARNFAKAESILGPKIL